MSTTEEITLSAEQQHAADEIESWFSGSKDGDEFVLAGLAGTGKSTLVAWLVARGLPVKMTLCPTGKAANVLREKDVEADTIHSAIYHFVEEVANADGSVSPIFTDNPAPDLEPGDLVVIDESSMVTADLAEDLRKLGLRILWVGDHGQLEPVGDDPDLMGRPDAALETVQRQAEGSPIIRLAHKARGGTKLGAMQTNAYAGTIDFHRARGAATIANLARSQGYDQTIVWTNAQRHAINRAVREMDHREALLEVGERVICLKNDRQLGLYNGMQFTVVSVDLAPKEAQGENPAFPDCIKATVTDGLRTWPDLLIYAPQFGRQAEEDDIGRDGLRFDYGYVITAHKSQGSEWPSVLVIDPPKEDMARWRYTAVTRASERLGIIA